MDNSNCKNCNENIVGLYCSSCGQKKMEVPIGRKYIVDSIVSVFDFDRGFGRTLAHLVKKPEILNEYLDGRTIPYAGPFKYIFTMLGILFILNFGLRAITNQTTNLNELFVYLDNILPIPLIVGINWILFRRKNICEHFIIVVYWVAQFTLIFAFLGLIFYFFSEPYLEYFLLSFFIAYQYWFYGRIFGISFNITITYPLISFAAYVICRQFLVYLFPVYPS